jgi:hypothetical protein
MPNPLSAHKRYFAQGQRPEPEAKGVRDQAAGTGFRKNSYPGKASSDRRCSSTQAFQAEKSAGVTAATTERGFMP